MERPSTEPARPPDAPLDFIRAIVVDDSRSGKHGGRVATRFPPEPNGYLHIGHAKSICLNFGVAAEFGGTCNLRFDDTNPTKEEVEYVDSIKADVRWLGFDWGDRLFYASDYFEQLYEYAVHLIEQGKAYVDSLTRRGDARAPRHAHAAGHRQPVPIALDRREPRRCSPRMRAGEFRGRRRTCCAPKIDMASPNINMRDPVLYRIRRAHHHRTGDAWCIYPMYDFAHPPSDALERITHSLCTLEFEDHRPLYDWLIDNLPVPAKPQQIEFARLNLTYTLMSKRKLLELVQEGTRRRLGRPAHAHDRRHAPARLHAGGDPRVLRSDRRRQAREHRRRRAARARRARGSQPPRAAGDGRARSAARGHRELSRGAERDVRDRQQPGGSVVPATGACRSRASCGSSATTSARIRRRSSSGWRRAARCGCAARISSPAPASTRTRRPERSPRCAAPTIRRRAAATRPTAARSRRRCTGCRRRTRSTSRCGSTIACSPARIRERRRTTAPTSTPKSLEVAAALQGRAERGRGRGRHALPVRARRLLLRRPRLHRRSAGLQPHGHAQGHLGEDRSARIPGLKRRWRRDRRHVMLASRLLSTTLATVALSGAAVTVLTQGPGRGAAAQADLPDGPGKAQIQAMCASCHPLTNITGSRGYNARRVGRADEKHDRASARRQAADDGPTSAATSRGSLAAILSSFQVPPPCRSASGWCRRSDRGLTIRWRRPTASSGGPVSGRTCSAASIRRPAR